MHRRPSKAKPFSGSKAKTLSLSNPANTMSSSWIEASAGETVRLFFPAPITIRRTSSSLSPSSSRILTARRFSTNSTRSIPRSNSSFSAVRGEQGSKLEQLCHFHVFEIIQPRQQLRPPRVGNDARQLEKFLLEPLARQRRCGRAFEIGSRHAQRAAVFERDVQPARHVVVVRTFLVIG